MVRQPTSAFSRSLDAPEILSTIQRTGFCLLKQALLPETVDALRSESAKLFADRPKTVVNIMPKLTDGSYFLSLREMRKVDARTAAPNLSVAHDEKIRPLLESALGAGFGISAIIYDFRQPSFEGELFPLHWDHFKISGCIKIYAHLDSVDRENGAMRLVPGTNSLIRDVLHANGETVSLYKSDYDNTFERLMAMVAKTPAGVLAPHAETLARLEEIERNPDASYKYVLSAEKGDVVIFDPMTLHGGGVISGRSRHIFRIHYVGRNYVDAYLPDQMTFPRFLAWKAKNVVRRFERKRAPSPE